jgi:dihydroorotase
LATITSHPAALLGLQAGSLEAGRKADFSLVNLDAPWIVDADNLRSKSKNAAIDGRKLQGVVAACYVSGKRVFDLGDNNNE